MYNVTSLEYETFWRPLKVLIKPLGIPRIRKNQGRACRFEKACVLGVLAYNSRLHGLLVQEDSLVGRPHGLADRLGHRHGTARVTLALHYGSKTGGAAFLLARDGR